MVKCEINETDSGVTVTSDYNKKFVEGARNLSGKWSAPSWVFDKRDIDDVKALCAAVYGWSEHGAAETVEIEIYWVDGAYRDKEPLTYNGIEIARAFGRDSGAKVAAGVKILSGGFDSGGSVKNWETIAKKDTRILLRDVPASLFVETDEETQRDFFVAKIVGQQIDYDALRAERTELVKRIAEIDNLLDAQG